VSSQLAAIRSRGAKQQSRASPSNEAPDLPFSQRLLRLVQLNSPFSAIRGAIWKTGAGCFAFDELSR
jgi:hypothetical protein